MKKFTAGLIGPVMLTMIACEPIQVKVGKDEAQDKTPKTLTTKKFEFETPIQHNERKVRMGEILAQSPIGFTHAARVFDEVLLTDPENDKALFYSALLDLGMAYKGIYAQSEDLWDKAEDFQRAREYTRDNNYPEFFDYLFAPSGKKYQTYGQAQKDILGKMQNSYKRAIAKLGKVDNDVTLILTQIKTANKEIEYDCQDYGDYTECYLKDEMTGIQALDPKKKTVDVQDIKVLVGSLKGMLNYARFYSAYSIEGQEEITAEIKAKQEEYGRALTDLETHNIAKKYPKYLSLDADNELPEVSASLEEMVQIGMDLESLNNKFCDTQTREMNLIQTICFDENARQDMEETLDYLAGPKETTLGLDAQGQPVKILVDLPGYLSNPIQDLKSLIADMDYDQDGQGSITREPKLNGLFPNNDLMEKLKLVVDENN